MYITEVQYTHSKSGKSNHEYRLVKTHPLQLQKQKRMKHSKLIRFAEVTKANVLKWERAR